VKNEQKERRIKYLIFLCEKALTSYFDSDLAYLVMICLKMVSSTEKYHPIILENINLMAQLRKIHLN
jgi:hypothetical protein